MLLTPESRRNSFFTRGGCARLLLQSYQYPNLSQGADRVAGQLRGDKECPFRGVTKSSRVWRKVPESDARSVRMIQTTTHFMKPHKRHRHRMIQTTTHSRKPHKRQTQNDTDYNPLIEAAQKTQNDTDNNPLHEAAQKTDTE